jgi:hypothetical protein
MLANISKHLLCSVKLSSDACMFQMTQRFDLYAESLAKVAQPDYKPQIVREN